MLLDINPGDRLSSQKVERGGVNNYDFTDSGGVTYFTANDGVHGNELWKTDGTSAGTEMVKDIFPVGEGILGLGDSSPTEITDVNGTLFFVVEASHKNELWKSDGTAAGTVLLNELGLAFRRISRNLLTAVGGTLFFQNYDATTGLELWKSDGTAAGTVLVKDILPGSTTSIPSAFTNLNGTLYFSANDGVHGPKLWKSDGTAAGTVVFDPAGSGASSIIEYDGGFVFRGSGGLWRSDGTEAGTTMVKDIRSRTALS